MKFTYRYWCKSLMQITNIFNSAKLHLFTVFTIDYKELVIYPNFILVAITFYIFFCFWDLKHFIASLRNPLVSLCFFSNTQIKCSFLSLEYVTFCDRHTPTICFYFLCYVYVSSSELFHLHKSHCCSCWRSKKRRTDAD